MVKVERALRAVVVWITGTGRASVGLPRTVIFVSGRNANPDTRQMLRSEALEPTAMPVSPKALFEPEPQTGVFPCSSHVGDM